MAAKPMKKPAKPKMPAAKKTVGKDTAPTKASPKPKARGDKTPSSKNAKGSKAIPYQGTAPQAGGGIGMGGYGL